METKSERLARGRPVGWDVPYAAMGGLVGFSSFLEGHLGQGPAGRPGEAESMCPEREAESSAAPQRDLREAEVEMLLNCI